MKTVMRHAPIISRDRQREWTTGAAVMLMVGAGLGAVFAGSYALTTAPHVNGGGDAPAGSTRQELRTGSVLFVPMRGNVCRQSVIDNDTWLIRDAGEVVCDDAVSWNSSSKRSGSPFMDVRVHAIRNGFWPK